MRYGLTLLSLLLLSACDGGAATATQASLQAQQAKHTQEQYQQLKQQIDQANAKGFDRLQQLETPTE